MEIKTYLISRGGNAKRDCPVLAQLAAKAGCTPETLYMVALGHKRPSGALARAIDEASGAVISRYDLRPDVFGSPEGKVA